MAFTPRTTADGMWNNPYWYDTYYNRGAKWNLWLPNCTTYAYGRSVEIAGGQIDADTILGTMPNAGSWYSVTNWEKSSGTSDMRLGDIVVWGQGGGVGSAGHVAVIEAIEGDRIWISQSHYYSASQTKTFPGLQSTRYMEYGYFSKSESNHTFHRTYYYNTSGSYPSGGISSFTAPNLIGTIHNPYAGQQPVPVPATPSLSVNQSVFPTTQTSGTFSFAFTAYLKNILASDDPSPDITLHPITGLTFTSSVNRSAKGDDNFTYIDNTTRFEVTYTIRGSGNFPFTVTYGNMSRTITISVNTTPPAPDPGDQEEPSLTTSQVYYEYIGYFGDTFHFTVHAYLDGIDPADDPAPAPTIQNLPNMTSSVTYSRTTRGDGTNTYIDTSAIFQCSLRITEAGSFSTNVVYNGLSVRIGLYIDATKRPRDGCVFIDLFGCNLNIRKKKE